MAYTKRLSEPRFLFVSVCVCFLLFLWPGLLAMYVSVCLSVCIAGLTICAGFIRGFPRGLARRWLDGVGRHFARLVQGQALF